MGAQCGSQVHVVLFPVGLGLFLENTLCSVVFGGIRDMCSSYRVHKVMHISREMMLLENSIKKRAASNGKMKKHQADLETGFLLG